MSDVFLMGTCGNSQWRKSYIEALNGVGRTYYDPVVPNWTPADGKREAEHLATSPAIVMVITTETEGFGSLAETGWTIANALKRGQRVGMYIELYEATDERPSADLSQRARKLTLEHAKRFAADYPDLLFLANSHDELRSWVVQEGLVNA